MRTTDTSSFIQLCISKIGNWYLISGLDIDWNQLSIDNWSKKNLEYRLTINCVLSINYWLRKSLSIYYWLRKSLSIYYRLRKSLSIYYRLHKSLSIYYQLRKSLSIYYRLCKLGLGFALGLGLGFQLPLKIQKGSYWPFHVQ